LIGALRLPFFFFFVLYEARPLALSPPLGFCPAFRVHAGDFGTLLVINEYYQAGFA